MTCARRRDASRKDGESLGSLGFSVSSPPGCRAGFSEKKGEHRGEKHTNQKGFKSGLIMFQRRDFDLPGFPDKSRAEDRSEQGAEGEIDEIDHARRRAAQLRWIRLLDHRVG